MRINLNEIFTATDQIGVCKSLSWFSFRDDNNVYHVVRLTRRLDHGMIGRLRCETLAVAFKH